MSGSRPRCLMLLDNSYRPDERPKREIATLVAAGWDVVLICEKAHGLPDVVCQGGLEIRRVDVPWRGKVVAMAASRKQGAFIDYIRKEWGEGFDVVHCHDWLTLPVGTQIARALGARLVYDSHEYFAGMTRPGRRQGVRARLRQWIRQRREDRALRSVDLLITVSPLIGTWFRERRGFRKRIVILRNMPDWSSMPTPDPGLRSRLQIPVDVPLLVHCGNLRFESRRVDVVVKALAGHVQCHLLCVGDGEVVQLMALAKEAGVEHRVHHLSAVPNAELGGVLAACDLGLSVLQPGVPNHEAALPNKLFEYLLAGVPVLGSPIQSQRQFLEEEGAGWSMATLSEESCAEILGSAIPELDRVRARISDQRARFVWSSQEPALVNAYLELLE